MIVSGTLPQAGAVTIVQVIPNGSNCDVVYVDGSGNMKLERVFAIGQGVSTSAINVATSVTVSAG